MSTFVGDTKDGLIALTRWMLERLHSPRMVQIVQAESAECGLACLAMILAYLGRPTSLIDLRSRFKYSLHGSTLAGLIETSKALNLISRALRVELRELNLLKLPCIIHVDFNHFVVLERARRHKVVICDPAVGRIVLSQQELSRRFSGVALELFPSPNFRTKAASASLSFVAIARQTRGIVPAILRIFAFALLLECLALTSPLMMQLVIDGALQDQNPSSLPTLGMAFGLILSLQVLVSMIKSRSALSVSLQLSTGWSANIFSHLLSLPDSYFSKRSVGDVETRFSAAQQIQDTLTTRLVSAALDAIMAILSISLLFVYSMTLTCMAIAALIVYVVIKFFFYSKMRLLGYSQIVAYARQQSLFIESVRGSTIIRMNNMQHGHVSRFVNTLVATNNANLKAQIVAINFDAVHAFVFGLMRIGLLCLGAYFALSRNFTAGMLISFIAYNDQFAGRSTSLVDFIFQLRLLRIQGERISDILLTAPEINQEGECRRGTVEPSIECRGVSFRYSDQEAWILKNCSFTVASGEFVAITGPSGCGKSTLIKLLAGLIEPVEGEILFGGVPINQLGKHTLRQNLSAVLQDDILFAGTIAENIGFFDTTARAEEVEHASILAGIHEDIQRLPMRYHTLVGDMGSSLSGGQKQRICLARAIYRRPKALLLDEATSHLDLIRERNVFANVSRMPITRIIVAHRPETIGLAGREVRLVNGRVEEGNFVKEGVA